MDGMNLRGSWTACHLHAWNIYIFFIPWYKPWSYFLYDIYIENCLYHQFWKCKAISILILYSDRLLGKLLVREMPNGMLLLAVSSDILCVQKVNGTSFPFLGYLFIECISVAHASLRFWFSRLHQQQILLSHRRKVSSQPGMVVAKASLVRSSSSFRQNMLYFHRKLWQNLLNCVFPVASFNI